MNEPYLKQILRSKNAEECAHLIAMAMDNYSEKISAACAGYECDCVFAAVVLKKYADEYAKRVPPNQRTLLRMLEEAAKDSGEEVVTRVPSWMMP